MQNTWNLELLYKDLEDPQIKEDIQKSIEENKKFVEKWKNNKGYLEKPEIMLEALTDYENLMQNYGLCTKPSYYYSLLFYLDQTNTDIKARINKLDDITTDLENNIQFFSLSISKIPEEKQKIFLDSPLLQKYHHMLETSFASGKYVLSDKEEKILNITYNTSYENWVEMLSTLLDKQKTTVKNEDGKEVDISYNEISKYLDSKKKDVRNYASSQFNKVNEKYLEIAEYEMNSVLEHKKSRDKVRNYAKPELATLVSDDIEPEIVDSLVSAVTDNFDISQQYYKYKAKMLGQKTLGYHERNVPIAEDVNKEYTYDNAQQLVEESFRKLDEEFYNIVKSFYDNGQYDVFPKQGKYGGAFCVSVGKNLPTYILLNHTNTVDDVLTIAHESGHGIHTELSKSQSELNCDYPISLAEIASTFFEGYVLDDIISMASQEEKISLYNQKLNRDISTIFRQIAFYNFEKDLHKDYREKGFLDKDYICNLFAKHMNAYLGDAVDTDTAMKLGWIYVGHFRRYFYVYSYASGLLIAKSLLELVKEDKKNVEKVKMFLSSGSTKSPRDLFNSIGIDITKKEFWMKGINSIRNDMKLLDLDSN